MALQYWFIVFPVIESDPGVFGDEFSEMIDDLSQAFPKVSFRYHYAAKTLMFYPLIDDIFSGVWQIRTMSGFSMKTLVDNEEVEGSLLLFKTKWQRRLNRRFELLSLKIFDYGDEDIPGFSLTENHPFW